MDHSPSSFYSDRKWCPECEGYVPYLMSLATSYCAECGGEVRLFSKEDWETFSESMKSRRPHRGKRKEASGASTRRTSAKNQRDTA